VGAAARWFGTTNREVGKMLTAFQVERVAYLTDGGVICRGCAISRFESEAGVEFDEPATWEQDDLAFEGIDLTPLSRFSVDELDSGEGIHDDDPDAPEDCGCTYGVSCDECNGEIVEPFVDEYAHQAS
jgi:hypothetical protein